MKTPAWFKIGNRLLHALGLVLLLLFFPPTIASAAPPRLVLHISVDGLGPIYLQPLVEQGAAPNFKRFQTEGAWTNNARTDLDFTITLPNHTCMLTSLPVNDQTVEGRAILGHQWKENGEPQAATLHSNRHQYVSSVFDVAHDHGLKTGIFATKTKFVLYAQSFDAANGAPDKSSTDHGRAKIDLVTIEDKDTPAMVAKLLDALQKDPPQYAFVHFHDTDTAGHAEGWGGPRYEKAIREVDARLGEVFAAIEANKELKDHTVIILTADHGGRDRNHAENSDPLDFTIPFYVWGEGVAKGRDLYAINPKTRKDPVRERTDYTTSPPPVRNGDSGNLALKILELPAIPDSLINAKQDLGVGAAK